MQHVSQFYSKGMKPGSRRAKISFPGIALQRNIGFWAPGSGGLECHYQLGSSHAGSGGSRITAWNKERAKQCLWNKTPILAAAVRSNSSLRKSRGSQVNVHGNPFIQWATLNITLTSHPIHLTLVFNVVSRIKLEINAAALTFGSQIHAEALDVIYQEKLLTESQLQEDPTGHRLLPP